MPWMSWLYGFFSMVARTLRLLVEGESERVDEGRGCSAEQQFMFNKIYELE